MHYQWSYVAGAGQHQWLLKRNCAMSPAQLGCWFGSLAMFSLGLAAICVWWGAWPVLPFTLIEVAALVLAFLWWAKHAADYERIVVSDDGFYVEASSGEQLRTIARRHRWTRVEYDGSRRESIRIVAGGDAIEVGFLVPPARRAALAREMRGALALQPALRAAR